MTANRRFAFSASRRLGRPDWSASRNHETYGAGSTREWGSGENYAAHLVIAGEPDPVTGMLVNLTALKAAFEPVVENSFDHAFLNLDTPPFDRVPPTPELLARELLARGQQACAGLGVAAVACHLAESPHSAATAYADGRIERDWWLDFSAARVTRSPYLTDAENEALFGRAASPLGHGHGYRLRVTLAGPLDRESGQVASHGPVSRLLAELHDMLDHRNLNLEVPMLARQPITTECLARFIYVYLWAHVPIARVRLYEMPHFFAEYDGERGYLGLERSFSAAHCLRVAGFSEEQNRQVFGKCANPNGHGHRYTVQATVAAPINDRTGIVFALDRFVEALEQTLGSLDGNHLDREVEAFRSRPSTGENIALTLWPQLFARLDERLVRLRIFETPNNRFTLRADGGRQ
ncbi:MAG TPA: 6-carboxytetrahydropterin synthase [Thermoanaerobaculaceae bacterium]|nr:6-carboxytetrahydropterin synthase [Thermoanaerobaculaceae bacterium]HRS16274.1 6-carboxytetrahydropterin synthase [Thermoanaerobaculaceae bacterium]